RRGRRTGRGNPAGAARVAPALGRLAQRRTLAARLVLVREVDAVLGGHLRRGAADEHLAALRLACRETVISDPVPAREVTGIRVGDDPLHRGLGVQPADAAVEPQAVALDRAAIRHARVVGPEDARGLGDAGRALLVTDVVAARPVAGAVVERRAAELVAARARHEVHH